MLCENNHVTRTSCLPHIRHCPTCRAGLQQFTDVHGNRQQDSAFNFCRHFQHGCRIRVANDYDTHACRFKIFNHISPAAVALVFRIADIAYYSLGFGLDEPYCMVQPTPELEELQYAFRLSLEFLWERLVPCSEQLNLMVQIIDNY